MNTMLENNNNIKNQVMKFASDLKKSGKNPEQLLNEAISSGKYSQTQINTAKLLAEKFMKLF